MNLGPGVRKVFVNSDRGGSETAYWEETWDAIDLDDERNRVLEGPVATRLDSFIARRNSRVLEAGCGTGAVAVALGSLGHEVVGLDLAAQTISRASRTWNDFRGAVGDVRRMPFADGSFDAVVSLGVLEHDQAGPLPALEEHRRVLRSGGVLLVTVPRISPLKGARDLWNLGLRRKGGYESRGRWVERRRQLAPEVNSRPFHQYEFRRRAWHDIMRSAGFEILESVPHGVGAGLGDLAPLLGRSGPPSRKGEHGPTDPPATEGPRPSGCESSGSRTRRAGPRALGARWKAAITNETPDDAAEEVLVRAGQYLLGHMDLTVAKRAEV